MFEIINTYLPDLLMLVLVAAMATVGMFAGRYLNTEVKQIIARNAMLFVEQTVRDLHGEDKMKAALEKASKLLAKHHIKFDAEEMRTLIEAALGAFNKSLNQSAGVRIVDTEEDSTEAAPDDGSFII